MTLQIRDAGALREITGIQVKQAGVLRTIRSVEVMDGDALRLVWARNLAVTLSPDGVTTQGFQSSFTTIPVTAIASGGFTPYSYSWNILLISGTPSTASSPSAATTEFSKTGVPVDTSQTDAWQVTVTDSVGQTVTADINLKFTNLNGRPIEPGGGF